ncbi:MAG: SDR family oxidoreductase [Burkholderiales bacterium]
MVDTGERRVTVVTGANRGIGLEICRQLSRRDEMRVVLTSRDESKGRASVKALRADGLNVDYRQLDVTGERAAKLLAQHLAEAYGRCDVLINNAGVMLDPRGSRVLDSSVATYRETLEANFFGPLRLIQALVPLMKKGGYGRIVNMSSGQGQLSDMGTGTPAYRISKTALNALTRTCAAELAGSGILVNSMCPGWVRTDMGGPSAPRTLAQGADTAVWLATLPPDGPSGRFFRDRKSIPW